MILYPLGAAISASQRRVLPAVASTIVPPGRDSAAPGPVVIGYDGSDEAENAIQRASELLAPRRAVVAFVWDLLSELLLHTDFDNLTGSMREAAEAALMAACSAYPDIVPHDDWLR